MDDSYPHDVRVPYGARRAELEKRALEKGIENAGSLSRDQLLDALKDEAKPEPKKKGKK